MKLRVIHPKLKSKLKSRPFYFPIYSFFITLTPFTEKLHSCDYLYKLELLRGPHADCVRILCATWGKAGNPSSTCSKTYDL